VRAFKILITPRFFGFLNEIKSNKGNRKIKSLILTASAIILWLILFFIFYRLLIYFSSQELIGFILAKRLLGMVILVLFSILIFSNIITALSNLYLSQDLELCHSSPATKIEIFFSRSFYSLVDSTWMPAIFGAPVVIAYGLVYHAGVNYYLNLLNVFLPIMLISASLGIMCVMILVKFLPAQRAGNIVMYISIILIIILYLLFRFLRPEKLVNPEAFTSIAQYLTELKTPDSPYLPSYWATSILWASLIKTQTSQILNHLLLWSTALSMVIINTWLAAYIYFDGFSKSLEAKRRSSSGKRILETIVSVITKPFAPNNKSLISKEAYTFFRDNTQWTQLLLLAALILVYLYNFSVLPLEKSPIKSIYLQNALSFLNIGMAGFVISALAVRFVFPSISSEGKAFWIILSSPLSLQRFLWCKFFSYLIPLAVISEILIVYSNYLLRVGGFMMVLSSTTIFFMVFGIVALGVGFGSTYPNFEHENIAKIATSYGGFIYMVVSFIFIAITVVVEAGPVYSILSARFKGEPISELQWIWIACSFIFVVFLSILTVKKSMSAGIKALTNYGG
jgi:ABC-2 type transport system permease protein